MVAHLNYVDFGGSFSSDENKSPPDKFPGQHTFEHVSGPKHAVETPSEGPEQNKGAEPLEKTEHFESQTQLKSQEHSKRLEPQSTRFKSSVEIESSAQESVKSKIKAPTPPASVTHSRFYVKQTAPTDKKRLQVKRSAELKPTIRAPDAQQSALNNRDTQRTETGNIENGKTDQLKSEVKKRVPSREDAAHKAGQRNPPESLLRSTGTSSYSTQAKITTTRAAANPYKTLRAPAAKQPSPRPPTKTTICNANSSCPNYIGTGKCTNCRSNTDCAPRLHVSPRGDAIKSDVDSLRVDSSEIDESLQHNNKNVDTFANRLPGESVFSRLLKNTVASTNRVRQQTNIPASRTQPQAPTANDR